MSICALLSSVCLCQVVICFVVFFVLLPGGAFFIVTLIFNYNHMRLCARRDSSNTVLCKSIRHSCVRVECELVQCSTSWIRFFEIGLPSPTNCYDVHDYSAQVGHVPQRFDRGSCSNLISVNQTEATQHPQT